MPRKPRTPPLEKSLQDLETLVQQLEHGETCLEDALKLFEKGVILTRQCQQVLSEAEQKVDMLMGEKIVPFDSKPDRSQENKADAT